MTVALIAGAGGLPPVLASNLMTQGRAPIICEMRGHPSDIDGEFQRLPFRIETLGTFLETLTLMGVGEVCMAGAVQRPAIDPSAVDATTAPLVPRLLAAMKRGDDGTLREVIAIFQEHGFDVVGAHQIAPDLVPAAGVHTKVSPPDLTDGLATAHAALAGMGHADQGQAVLFQDVRIIACEDARGTAAMLHDHRGLLARGDRNAVLFKAPKPGQSLLADMPLIGPDTALQAAEAGLAGIVISAGGVMVLDLQQVVAILDAQKMFLWVRP